MVVYPLQGVQANTMFFSTVGASVVASSDVETYASFCDKFPGLKSLSLQTGNVGRDKRVCEQQTTTWLFLQSNGTATVTFSDSSRRASMLLGLLMSAYRIKSHPNAFVHSMGHVIDTATQFSGGRAAYSVRGQNCGPLLHATVGICKFDDTLLLACERWLQKMKAAATDLGQRALAAARWVNHAVVSSGTTRFLFLFFAIDALFGERHYVLETIRRGVVGSAGHEWDARCERLFKLRSELVHGGAPSVSEWSEYERYRDHFDSEPEDDMELLAATCLMNYWGK
ncbi:MAG: hypothetical protein ABL985_05795 [Casimicrobium sp.]